MASPLELAARALARRDRSEADLRRILDRKGVDAAGVDAAVEALRRAGAIDDVRFAAGAAASLARRGYGDRAIVFRLQRDGIDREQALEALAELEPEEVRAAAFVERRGASERTVRWLTARGFTGESIDHAVEAIADAAASELG